MPLSKGRREYNPISARDGEDENVPNTEHEDGGEMIRIIILDSAQHRFFVSVDPDWTVEKLKEIGVVIHKVPVQSQRLIFRGKMLDDSKILKEIGVVQDDCIIHLFPKPRVVVTSSNDSSVHGFTADDREDSNESGPRAHVPQIVLDEAEQERRGQILVLGSVEIAEAQNNVKLLSLLLLVTTSMRLLALFSIAMGVAEEPVYNDDLSRNHTVDNTTGNYEIRTWENSDYFDLLVSAIGFYVATLGMKATTENSLRLATAYMIGTVIAAIGWNVWNVFQFVLFVKKESEPSDDDEVIPLTRDDYVTVAVFTVMLPMLVWGLCFLRAWEFRRLIEEAELEAAERIRSQLTVSEGNREVASPRRELTV